MFNRRLFLLILVPIFCWILFFRKEFQALITIGYWMPIDNASSFETCISIAGLLLLFVFFFKLIDLLIACITILVVVTIQIWAIKGQWGSYRDAADTIVYILINIFVLAACYASAQLCRWLFLSVGNGQKAKTGRARKH